MNVSAGLLIAGIIRCWYRRWRDSLFEQSQKCLFCQKDEVIFIVVDEVKTQLSFFGLSALSVSLRAAVAVWCHLPRTCFEVFSATSNASRSDKRLAIYQPTPKV